MHDDTVYPSNAWTPTNLTYVENMPATYLSGPSGCLGTVQPVDCARGTTIARAPYSSAPPVPADLIVPLATLGSVDGVQVIGEAQVDGHDTVQVQMPFSRAGPLFPFLSLGGTWRPFFADDPVTVWLDTTGWYPSGCRSRPRATRRARTGRCGSGCRTKPPARRSWTSRSDRSRTRAPIRPSSWIRGRHVVSPVDMQQAFGYVPAEPAAPAPLSLVAAIAPKRAPSAPSSVLLYADGLDYLRVAEDRRWSGPGPFGPIGLDAEQVRLPGVGPALYEPSGDGLGRRLSLHTAGTDLLLESNLPRDELFTIASTLGVRSAPVPAPWDVVHAGDLTLVRADPRSSLRTIGLDPDALTLPDGYVPASATRSVEQGVGVGVTVTFRQRDSDSMGPPLQIHVGTARDAIDSAPDPERVSIGATTGRYSRSGSVVTWTHGGRSWSVQGDVDLAHLVAIASSVLGAAR